MREAINIQYRLNIKCYAQKLIEAGVFTELHVETGVPHAYEDLTGSSQAVRHYELRDNATARMRKENLSWFPIKLKLFPQSTDYTWMGKASPE